MSEQAHEHGEHRVGHVSPIWQLGLVLFALLVLTIMTVAVTGVDMGNVNIWIALAIAVVKGALVCLYFMHLRYEAPFNAMIFILALAFVALFIGITLVDTGEYQDIIKPPPNVQVSPGS